jgi:16S rRNA processing protein RimM
VLLEVGRITKAHGLAGQVLVALSSDRTSRLDPGSVLSTERGELTVESASRHQDRWMVKFAEIEGRDAAETWRGTLLRAEPLADDDDDAMWVHQLVGAVVTLADATTVGTVTAVEANPASDLLVLDSGALVPVVFVTDHAPGRITIDPPEGLFDL